MQLKGLFADPVDYSLLGCRDFMRFKSLVGSISNAKSNLPGDGMR